MFTDLVGQVLQSANSYSCPRTGKISDRIKSLIDVKSFAWDWSFLESYILDQPNWPRTPFVGIERNAKYIGPARENRHWKDSVFNSLCFAENSTREIWLSLSDGFDSQLLALLAKKLGFRVRALSLSLGVGSRAQDERILDFCKVHEIQLHFVQTNLESLRLEMRNFVREVEHPIFGVEPLKKWHLAKAAKSMGLSRIVSGDGADQIFRGQISCNLYFLSQICFARHNVDLITPFATRETSSWISETQQEFSDKEPLRNWALEEFNYSSPPKKSMKHFAIDQDLLRQSMSLLESYLCAE